MSQIRLISRSDSEQSGHLRTTIVLVVAPAALFLAADWMAQATPVDVKIPSESGLVVDWSPHIEAILRELPHDSSKELTLIRQQVLSVGEELTEKTFTESSKTVIEQALTAVRRKAAESRVDVPAPSVDDEQFIARLEAETRSLEQAERTATDDAIQAAEEIVRTEKGQELRDLRLLIRDQQDRAADLRLRITQLQREQREFQEKTARAQALQADMPDVRRYLQAFTTPGHHQPMEQIWSFEWVADAKPVSLSRLKKRGALQPTTKGYESLYNFAGGKSPTVINDRPLGGFPKFVPDHRQHPEIFAAVKRAQELLREHGLALVEAKLLSP